MLPTHPAAGDSASTRCWSTNDAGDVDLSVEQLDAWMESLEAADRDGQFLYSHVTYIVVAEKS